MIKEFFVDKNRKNTVNKQIQDQPGEYRLLKVVLRLMGILMWLLPLLFLGYAYFVSDGFVHLHSRYAPVGTKNHWFIAVVAGTLLVLLFFFWLIVKTVYSGLAGRKTRARLDESLIYHDGVLEYGFRRLTQTSAFDRAIIKIPLDRLEKVLYNPKTTKITFVGAFCGMFLSDTEDGEQYQNGTFDIYDYFKPGLLSFLEGLDLTIVKEEV